MLVPSNKGLHKKICRMNNPITPVVLGYYEIPNGEAELSTSSKYTYNRDKLYGVSVIRDEDFTDESTCFKTKEEALEYIDKLNEDKHE